MGCRECDCPESDYDDGRPGMVIVWVFAALLVWALIAVVLITVL